MPGKLADHWPRLQHQLFSLTVLQPLAYGLNVCRIRQPFVPCLQLVQGKLADMYTVTQATRALLYRTAAQADAGQADRKDCAAVILYAAEHATRMALDAIQLLGGNGYIQVRLLGRAETEG